MTQFHVCAVLVAALAVGAQRSAANAGSVMLTRDEAEHRLVGVRIFSSLNSHTGIIRQVLVPQRK